MSIEVGLKKMLFQNGYVPKATKIGSIWTLEKKDQKCSVVNYHNNDTVAFNYLANFMRELVKKKYPTVLQMGRSEQDRIWHKALSSLPFYEKIKNAVSFKWSAKKGNEYLSISSQVGLDVFKDVVHFIGNDSKLENLSSPSQFSEAFLPDWLYVKTVIDLIQDEAPTIDEILDATEKKVCTERKVLKNNWREITRENIPRWLVTKSE